MAKTPDNSVQEEELLGLTILEAKELNELLEEKGIKVAAAVAVASDPAFRFGSAGAANAPRGLYFQHLLREIGGKSLLAAQLRALVGGDWGADRGVVVRQAKEDRPSEFSPGAPSRNTASEAFELYLRQQLDDLGVQARALTDQIDHHRAKVFALSSQVR